MPDWIKFVLGIAVFGVLAVLAGQWAEGWAWGRRNEWFYIVAMGAFVIGVFWFSQASQRRKKEKEEAFEQAVQSEVRLAMKREKDRE